MQDILLNTEFDLIVEGGDFKVGDGTEQDKALLLISTQGEFRENPVLGVGLVHYLNDNNPADLEIEVIKQLELVGMSVGFVAFENGALTQEASYSELQSESDRLVELVDTERAQFFIKVKSGQSAIDLCIQYFGRMDNYVRFLKNVNQDFDWNIGLDDPLLINAPAGDIAMVDYFKSIGRNIATKDLGAGEFNDDYNDSFNI